MTVDVAVVGNGVLGLSIALELVRRSPGTRVAVVGPASRRGSATAAAGAMLNCFAEVTDATDRHPASRAKFALAREALDAWPQWFEGLHHERAPSAPFSLSPGTFVVLGAQATPTAVRNFEAIHAALKQYAEPHHEVEPADIPGLRPVPHERPVRALYLEREGSLDARAVLEALENAGRRSGVTFLDGEASDLVSAHGRACGLRLLDGRAISAGTVVLAAGTGSQQLLDRLAPDEAPPLLHGTGFAVETRRQVQPGGFDRVVRTPARSGACGMHLVPLGDGVEYIGATNIVLFDPPGGPRIGVTQSLLRFATDQFDVHLGMSAIQRWHYGSRPVPLDRFPLLGLTTVGGLLLATGTYRDGFHSSPVIARHLADMVLDSNPVPGIFTPFAPVRAPIETMTVDSSIELFVADAVETATEYGLRLPYFLDPEPIVSHARHEAQQAFERLDHPLALAPEILGAVRDASSAHVQRLNAYLRATRTRHPVPTSAG
ncbi:FAD-binding oxidoreductase [Streptomyces sp. AP-93]|uniref:NAD(P)/FAD-dependent oxidoreductase n=1 Tax=Streptomyces sp. AP-93 TaxID=2929048 RepID=UPI001FAE8B80|nr:FAD-dependent oxidoreductase [Streptomyces sp. AP-93]MCJ0874238.1 FAD-binding oxidoreductase [Streptomyces sp. AP-93]